MAVKQLSDGGPDGANLGQSSADKIAFYGTTPIVQRSGAAQNTTALSTASSTAIDTATKAAIIEIMDTLRVLGLWKGSA
jgi:hypothetical protein